MAEEQTSQTEQKIVQPAQTDEQSGNTETIPFPLKTILGQKVGMTQIFSDAGVSIPVSVIHAGSCVATLVKSRETDGYNAVQLGTGERPEKSCSQPYLNQFKKRGLVPPKWVKEFKVSDPSKFQVGQKVSVDIFTPGDYVDVSGTSKGKGFAGVIKRHGFSGLPASHGASDKVNSRGSSGGGSGAPQRVLKGTRMAGHMGDVWVTTQKLEVVKVDKEQQLILLKGSVPGVNRGLVVIQETSRHLKHKRAPIIQKISTKKAVGGASAKKPAKPEAKAKA